MSRLLDLPLRYPRLTLAFMLATTIALAVPASHLRVDGAIENLLPVNDTERAYYENLQAVFGQGEIDVIGVFADDVFAPTTLAKIDRLSTALSRIEGVRDVVSLTTMKGVELGDMGLRVGRLMKELPTTEREATAFRQLVLANPIYRGNVVAADGRATAISVFLAPSTDLPTLRRIDEQIRSLLAKMTGPEQTAITGTPTLKVAATDLMERERTRFTVLSLLLVTFVLAWTFRSLRGVLLPLATVVTGVIWANGVMALLGSSITVTTLLLNPLLAVVGIASGIHMMSQYYVDVGPKRTHDDAIRRAMRHIALPVAAAGLTTMVGFATLTLAPAESVQEFGAYSVLGILAILTASFLVVPAALTLCPPPDQASLSHRPPWIERILRRTSELAARERTWVLGIGVGLVFLSCWGASRIQVETNYLAFFEPASRIRRDNALISDRLAGTQPIYVGIDGDHPRAITELATIESMNALQRYIDAQSGVDKTLSLVDYLELLRNALQPATPGPLPASQAEVDQLVALLGPEDLSTVVNRDYSRANITARTTLVGSNEVEELVRRVEDFAAAYLPIGIRAHVTGTVVLLARSADRLVRGQLRGLWQEVAVLLLVLTGLFVSLRVGLLALIPNVLPPAVLFGVMGWAGIQLNVATSMIAAIAIGISVDDTIHLLSAFNHELRRTGSQTRAVLYAIRSAGRAAVYISLTLIAGFLIVALSEFQPIRQFGLLSALTIAVALATELFLTPALLATTKIVTLWDLLRLRLGPDPHKQISLFRGLRPMQARVVVLMGHLERGKRGKLLTRRGELREELYVLLNGGAAVIRDDGGELRRHMRGDVLGEMGLVRSRARSATVVLTEDTDYLVLDKRFLNRLPRQYPRIAAKVFLNLTRILSDRLQSTTDQLVVGRRPRADRA